MQILLTNDDGIFSDGLTAMAEQLEAKGYEVWISAPDSERSAFSHALSLRHPIKFRKIRRRTYSCSGTPADCIFYGLKGALKVKPDLVISGINKGFNMGTDIIYSGTVGAAREAALHGIPSIAVSAGGPKQSFPFAEAAAFTAEHLELFVANWSSNILININVPAGTDGSWDVAYPEHREYGDSIEPIQVSPEETYYILAGVGDSDQPAFVPKKHSDMELLGRKQIVVTPIHIHPVMDEAAGEQFAQLARQERETRQDA
ncbi:MAG: 5'/3'-nucleotidase SurE [Spirochaetota bacterium]